MPTTNANLVKLHVACKNIPLNIHLFKVNNKNTRKDVKIVGPYEKSKKLKIKKLQIFSLKD